MDLVLDSLQRDSDVTIGALLMDGEFFCWTCEDPIREIKIYGETAIPRGRTYELELTYSSRFKQNMPLVKDVAGFSGIRIHPGNTAADTEGCILLGLDRYAKSVGRSRAAYKAFMLRFEDAIRQKRRVSLRINA